MTRLESSPKDLTNVNRPASTANDSKRVFNFNGGPGALPLPVLERIREELLDYRGTGMSVMEMSHRAPPVEEILDRAEKTLRRLMNISNDYAVIFTQGGGSLQFAMVPMNLYITGKPVDVLHTGMWTSKPIVELKKIAPYRLAGSSEAVKFTRIPRPDEIEFAPDASYVYMATNNTIEGTQWQSMPETGAVPLVADMSSDILSRSIDVNRFGLIFAGAQKNVGGAGVTLVVVRTDVLRTQPSADTLRSLGLPVPPIMMHYPVLASAASLYNTLPILEVFVCREVMAGILARGGLEAQEQTANAKAALLYAALDERAELYQVVPDKSCRSRMNICFRLAGGGPAEQAFLAGAESRGLMGLKGHRSVGGLRISNYNSITREAAEKLAAWIREFQG